MDKERAIVVTTDFFTPVVDDPYDYGAIAAANSLSDVYAMGGQPFLALNVAALPDALPAEFLGEILRGGAEKAREAGVVIAGGHTVKDDEPMYGLIVLGMVSPDKLLTKRGARVGDKRLLSKPLGFGVTTTALKNQQASDADEAEAVRWMTRLNKQAAEMALEFGAHAATDVTGFSLLGHGWEMAEASGVGLHFAYDRIPFTSGATRYADAWLFPGGASDNSRYFGPHVQFAPELDDAARMLLFDPQTSGGLLTAMPPAGVPALLARAADIQQPLWVIGEVVQGNTIIVSLS